jgi:hypothetical protein
MMWVIWASLNGAAKTGTGNTTMLPATNTADRIGDFMGDFLVGVECLVNGCPLHVC